MQQNNNKKVLIVDDDELTRLTLRNVMGKAGYTVFEAKDGNGGVALYKQENPALMITDILMPGKEGLETIQEVLEFDPEAKIIAISSGGTGQVMSFLTLAKDMGASRIIHKPVKPAELLNAVKILLGRY